MLVQWASHATWSAPRRAACIGISQQWRAYLTDGNSVTQAQVTSIKKNFIDLTVLAGDRNSILVAGALLRQPIRLSYATGGTSGHSRTREVRFWHIADVPHAPTNVRYRGQSGHDANGPMSANHPMRTFSGMSGYCCKRLVGQRLG